MKTVAIIQARMGSTRLPGKVMKLLCDKTVLYHVITRVKSCPLVDDIVIATTHLSSDDVIVQEAEQCGVKWFRGSEDNVLERYYLAATQHHAEVIVRVTSDCPLFDPNVLLQMLNYFKTKTAEGANIDYLSNTLTRSYPRGLDAEIFNFDTLEYAFQRAQQPHEREHVTPYIYQHPHLFALENFRATADFSNYRWTLDTQEDWQLIEQIYTALYKDGEIFHTEAVLALFQDRPYLSTINVHIKQKPL